MAETTPPVNPEAVAHAEAAQAEADRLAAEKAEAAGDTVSVRFNRPLSFGGVDYAVGVHDVPVAAIEVDQWFFDAHAADGNVAPGDNQLAADGTPKKIVRAPAKKTAKK